MKESAMIPRVKGTHDMLDMTLLDYFLSVAKTHLERYAFSHIATPLLEHTELFKRSLGLETDVVSKEMFTICATNSSESLCLRPEATASIMRAFLEAGQLPQPWKVYLIGPMFRHERPQKGRFRQFHQISCEMIGTDSPAQDVLFIAMVDRLFQKKLQIKHYALLLNFLGCPTDRAAFREILYAFLTLNTAVLCQNCQVRKEHNIMRVFDCKNEQCQELYTTAPQIADNLCRECK
jgi:histidyl-tRNA synthetase